MLISIIQKMIMVLVAFLAFYVLLFLWGWFTSKPRSPFYWNYATEIISKPEAEKLLAGEPKKSPGSLWVQDELRSSLPMNGDCEAVKLQDGATLALYSDGRNFVFDPRRKTSKMVGEMVLPRQDFGMACLTNGDVLICGGTVSSGLSDTGDSMTSSMEIYNPRSQAFILLDDCTRDVRCLGFALSAAVRL